MQKRTLLALAVVCLVSSLAAAQAPTGPSAESYFNDGVRFMREGQYPEALGAFRESARLLPDKPETLGNIGAVLLFLKRPEEAVVAFKEAIRLKPGEGPFYTGLCTSLSLAKQHAEALRNCEEGVRLSPESAEARINLLGAMERGKKPVAEIQRAIDAALARFAENEPLIEFAANFFNLNDRLDLAVQLWERLVTIRPASGYYNAQLSIHLLLIEREAEALNYAKKALELEPQSPHAHYFMGKLFLELGQHGDAVSALRKAAAAAPPIPNAHYNLALGLSRLGRRDLAVDAFREAIALDPEGFRVHYEYGRLLSGLGRYEDAIEPHRKALAINPKDFGAKVGLGLVLFESTNFEEAIKYLEEAQREKPGDEIVEMFLGVARARQQNIPQIEELKRYARANPENVNVRVDLIELLSFARRIEEAEPFVKEFFELNPKDTRAYQRVAVAYTTAGHPDKGLNVYLRSLEVEENAGAYFGIATIYAESGRNEEAGAAWIKGFSLRSDVPGFLTLYGHHLRDAGKRREALEAYKRSLALKPMNEGALASAAILSARLGEMDNARIYVSTLSAVDPKLARRIERCLPYLRYWL